ncbi:phosphate/phosphite/phosphonate ABC transporter substrate-binding protein [Thermoflexus sp.]|uniref:phosphate/phosphite/phosphonate ABC transporter substrate-binding protein n=1 Tax=Thermoflexus sp. TaxID=1969742 RepID=UPI00261AE34A|nr:phosphate/phosphite/phosphonate ABC transporter substrate-binding protein [Thermoflexus sp.]MCX7690296.1 phosphate/phosphite/phosphonate ABC transporter substrate-binding protein [Thermoflexus sp.]MDW8064355.1 phosphate/phosphite/phosphonate ABC transporter substrate-binding protein [Anaerolineae bacterium]
MRLSLHSFFLIGVLLGLGAACAPPQTQPTRVVIAVQPTLTAAEVQEKARPLEQYLEQRLGPGVEVEIYVPLSQAGVVEALRFGQAHVAFMGPFAGLLAVERAKAQVVLAEVREVIHDSQKTEATYYYSYWVVPKDSPYRSLEELRGKRACFPSTISTSGYIAPMARLIELGLLSEPPEGREVDPKTFFGQVLFAGGYGQCWEALKAGQVDVTIIAGDVPEKLYQEVLANTRVLEQQGPLPSHVVVVSPALQEPLRSKVIDALMGLSAPEYRSLMRQFISGIFVGFQRTDAQTHLGALREYVKRTHIAFAERINP